MPSHHSHSGVPTDLAPAPLPLLNISIIASFWFSSSPPDFYQYQDIWLHQACQATECKTQKMIFNSWQQPPAWYFINGQQSLHSMYILLFPSQENLYLLHITQAPCCDMFAFYVKLSPLILILGLMADWQYGSCNNGAVALLISELDTALVGTALNGFHPDDNQTTQQTAIIRDLMIWGRRLEGKHLISVMMTGLRWW